MLEVEMKFPVDNFTGLENKLAAASARGTAPIQEADHYFNAPDRDFARTDEALRLRRIGEKNRVTYKGPRTDAQTKTRKEIEVPLGEGDASAEGFMQILVHLGYRPVAGTSNHDDVRGHDRSRARSRRPGTRAQPVRWSRPDDGRAPCRTRQPDPCGSA